MPSGTMTRRRRRAAGDPGAEAGGAAPGPGRDRAPAPLGGRVASIDVLRGLVMLLMLVDHVRETVLLHVQVADPVDVTTTSPGLFFTRSLSHICAPVFIALTGLGAWLHRAKHTPRETAVFLLKRGAFLVLLELTVVGFAWTAEFPPSRFFLQVIWCIGICMIALAGLLHLRRRWQILLGSLLVAGHNLLDGIVLTGESPFFIPWAILHQREVIALGGELTARTSYPVLPWIGVILLGYAMGPWFARIRADGRAVRRLLALGAVLLAGFGALRWLNLYGDAPWFAAGDSVTTLMSFLSLTKYPPSLLFLLATLGAGAVLLALAEATGSRRIPAGIAIFGAAPMFFYVVHLYVLKAAYLVALAIYGQNRGEYFGVDSLGTMWLWVAALVLPLYFVTRGFARWKRRRRDLAWLRYF